jgi:hypothetical protein
VVQLLQQFVVDLTIVTTSVSNEALTLVASQSAPVLQSMCHACMRAHTNPSCCRHCYHFLPAPQAGAGNALCDLLSARAAAAAAAAAAADPSSSAAASAAAAADSQLALEGQLLEELLVRAPDAHWARARLAGLQLQLRQYEPAVSSYQAAIRCVVCWVCSGIANLCCVCGVGGWGE